MRRLLRWGAVAALLSTALLALGFVTRGAWLAPRLERLLVGTARDELGLRLRVGEIRGSYVTSLEIRGLRVEPGGPEGPLVAAEISRLRLEYSPWLLLRGLDPFLARLRIEVDGAAAELDLTRPDPATGVDPAPHDAGTEASLTASLPATLPTIQIGDAKVAVRGQGFRVLARGVTLDCTPTGVAGSSENTLDLTATHLEWQHPALRDGDTELRIVLGYRADTITVRRLELDGTPLVRQARLTLDQLPTAAPFSAELILAGGTAEVRGVLRSERLELAVDGRQLHLDRFADLLAPPIPPAAGIASFQVDAVVDLEHLEQTAGTAALEITDPSYAAWSVEVMTAELSVGEGRLSGGAVELMVADSRIQLTELAAPLAPLLDGAMEMTLAGLRGRFLVESTNLPAALAAAGAPLPATEAPAPPHQLTIVGEVADGALRVHRGELVAAEGRVVITGAALELPLGGTEPTAAAITLDGEVHLPDLGLLPRLIPLPPLQGNLAGTAHLSGRLGAPTGLVTLAGEDLAVAGVNLGRLRLDAEGDTENLTVSSLELVNGADRISAHGSYRIGSKRLDGVQLEIDLAELGPYSRMFVPELDFAGGSVRGSANFEGPAENPAGELELTILDLETPWTEVESLSLRATGAGHQLVMETLDLQTAQGTITLAGTMAVDPETRSVRARITDLDVQRGETALGLAAPAAVTYGGDGETTLEPLVLEGPIGSIRIEGRVGPDGTVELGLSVADLTSGAWLEDLAGDAVAFGGATLEIRAAGTLLSPRVSAKGTVEELTLGGMPTPLAGEFDLGYSAGGIEILSFRWRGPGGSGISARGQLPFDPLAEPPFLPGTLNLEAGLEAPDLQVFGELLAEQRTLRGTVSGTLRLGGTWAQPDGFLELTAVDLDLPGLTLPHPPGPLSLNCRASLNGTRAAVDMLRLDSPAAQLEFSGVWSGAPPLMALARGEAGDLSGELAGSGSFAVPDLSWLAEGVDALRRFRGRVAGELHLSGPVRAPQIRGSLQLEEGELRINGPMPSVQALTLRAEADPKGLRVDELRGELGGSPFDMTGSVSLAAGKNTQTELRLTGTDLLLYRNDGVKIRADTDILVRGPLSALEITGEVGLTDCRYVKNIDFLQMIQGSGAPSTGGAVEFSFPNPPLRDARIDLRVYSKNPFRVRNNLAALELRPELRVQGSGALPVVRGEVYLDPGRIELPAGRLRIESGTIRFLESDPGRPQLDVFGSSRMMGYDISVQVEGPYDEPVVTLSSTPPLANDELLLLVLAGTPPRSDFDEGTARQSSLLIATYLGRGVLSRIFGSESTESDESMADRFDVQVGREVSLQGEETIEATFRIAEDVLRDGDRVYLSGERDRYDAYNTGVRVVFRFP